MISTFSAAKFGGFQRSRLGLGSGCRRRAMTWTQEHAAMLRTFGARRRRGTTGRNGLQDTPSRRRRVFMHTTPRVHAVCMSQRDRVKHYGPQVSGTRRRLAPRGELGFRGRATSARLHVAMGSADTCPCPCSTTQVWLICPHDADMTQATEMHALRYAEHSADTCLHDRAYMSQRRRYGAGNCDACAAQTHREGEGGMPQRLRYLNDLGGCVRVYVRVAPSSHCRPTRLEVAACGSVVRAIPSSIH